jgi:hypothetical protein
MLPSLSLLVAAGGLTVPSPAMTPGESLAVFLTVESLLFAALGVGVTIQTTVEDRYLPKLFTTGRLAFWVAVTICCVAVGGAAAWYDLYAAGWPPSDLISLLESSGLAVGIAAQPLLAVVVWWGVRS